MEKLIDEPRILHILDLYLQKNKPNKTFLLGIDGLSGSGKTTLTAQLQKACYYKNIPVIVIHLDDHIVPREQRYGTGQEEWIEYYYLQWDRPRWRELLQYFRKPLDQSIQLEYYQKELDQYDVRSVQLTSQTFIIIEGVFLQREEWRSFFDFVIYLDVPRDVRDKRVLKRDAYIGSMEERLAKYQRRYWPAEDYYLENVQPKKFADLVMM